jgi:hypothetical protein
MGMFGSIGSIAGSYFGGPIGGQIGGMIGGALDGKGAVKGAQGMQGDVRAMSEAQYQRALPWDASGEFGSIKYDRSGKAVSSELSKPWQSQLDRLLGRATTTGEQISKYSADPMVAQQQLYEQQQALFRPQQERDILSLEARLQAQGKGGSTGGAGEMRALREAQYMKDLAREYGAFDRSMDMGTTMRKWEESDIGQATDIGKLPQDYLQMAKSGGITSDPYAKQKVQAAGNVYGAKSSRLDGIGSALSGMSGMLGDGSGAFGDLGSLGNFNTASTFNTNPWSEQSAMLAEQRM